jgi:hypothetical protein
MKKRIKTSLKKSYFDHMTIGEAMPIFRYEFDGAPGRNARTISLINMRNIEAPRPAPGASEGSAVAPATQAPAPKNTRRVSVVFEMIFTKVSETNAEAQIKLNNQNAFRKFNFNRGLLSELSNRRDVFQIQIKRALLKHIPSNPLVQQSGRGRGAGTAGLDSVFTNIIGSIKEDELNKTFLNRVFPIGASVDLGTIVKVKRVHSSELNAYLQTSPEFRQMASDSITPGREKDFLLNFVFIYYITIKNQQEQQVLFAMCLPYNDINRISSFKDVDSAKDYLIGKLEDGHGFEIDLMERSLKEQYPNVEEVAVIETDVAIKNPNRLTLNEINEVYSERLKDIKSQKEKDMLDDIFDNILIRFKDGEAINENDANKKLAPIFKPEEELTTEVNQGASGSSRVRAVLRSLTLRFAMFEELAKAFIDKLIKQDSERTHETRQQVIKTKKEYRELWDKISEETTVDGKINYSNKANQLLDSALILLKSIN